MEKIGQQFAANLRTNDLAFRYDTTTIALILGDTAEKEALRAVEPDSLTPKQALEVLYDLKRKLS